MAHGGSSTKVTASGTVSATACMRQLCFFSTVHGAGDTHSACSASPIHFRPQKIIIISEQALQLSMESCKEVVAKSSVRQLQEGQHYQLVGNPGCSASYSCNFTWKIDKVQQRKMFTLYSKPFYTAQNALGYKMCLMLFMDGDGSGHGMHVSYYTLH